MGFTIKSSWLYYQKLMTQFIKIHVTKACTTRSLYPENMMIKFHLVLYVTQELQI